MSAAVPKEFLMFWRKKRPLHDFQEEIQSHRFFPIDPDYFANRFTGPLTYGAWVSKNAVQPSRAVNAAEKTAGGKPKYLTDSTTPTT
jgi:hypothetical protein